MDVEHQVVREQRLLDQLAEGADRDRVRAGGGERLDGLGSVDALGLVQREPELGRGLGGRRRGELPPAARAGGRAG